MNSERKRILIVRLGSMGDIIHSLPVAPALKESFPEWEIDWLVESRWRDLLDSNPYLHRVVSLDTLTWRKQPLSPHTWKALGNAVASLRANHYDCALDIQAAIKSAVACVLAGAREVIGFDKPWVREPVCAALYTRRVQTAAAHIVDANLALAAALGANPAPARFPLPTGEPASVPARLPQSGFAVMNPGAGWRSKCWPPENYASLADALEQEFSLSVVLNCGPGEEALAREVQRHCRTANPQVYSGDLKGLIALLRRSCLAVGPDTGPLHLAAALGIATVGLFGPTDPSRNAPYGPKHRSLRAPNAETSYRHSSQESTAMRNIRPEEVLNAIREVLVEEKQTSLGGSRRQQLAKMI